MEEPFDGGGISLADISDDDSVKSPSYENLRPSEELMDTSGDTTSVPKKNTGAYPKVLSTHQLLPKLVIPQPAVHSSPIMPISVPLRHKVYPDSSKGPWVVFFRPKQKPLNISQISKDLTKHFSAVTDILRVTPGKMRVTVNDLKQANRIVACELFTMEYRVYIPSRDVEIEGVVTEASLTCEDFLHAESFGIFKNRALPNVKILDCNQMHSASLTGSKKTYSLSDSFRVTFSGSALPDYVTIGKVRLPVRLFVPRVMNCSKCKQLGHTAVFCSNKPRCDQCGEPHAEGLCSTPPKCAYCKETLHALVDCPKYRQQGEQLKRSLQARSKRSFAELLKNTAPSSQTTQNSNNAYSILPDDDKGPDSEGGESFPFAFRGNTRKRPIKNATQKPLKASRMDTQTSFANSRGNGNVAKIPPPGLKPCNVDKDFPILPGSSKTPDIPVFQPREQLNNQPEHAAMFTFSGIVDSIFNVFNVSDSTRNIINLVLPIVKTLLKQLASKWSFLASIISFDG